MRSEARRLLWNWRRQTRKNLQDGWELLGTLGDGSDGKPTAAALREALRKVLVPRQQTRCCYCRRWLVSIAHARPIEHVLPRVHYPQFSLHFWNLAIACRDCNSLKTATIWGSIKTTDLAYPRAASCHDFFHPRLHVFDEHVRFVRLESNEICVAVFVGKTPQGRHLCSKLLSRVAAKEMLVSGNQRIAPHLAKLQDFAERASSDSAAPLPALAAFQNALDESLLRMVGLASGTKA